MKLAPGTPLAASLAFNDGKPALPVGRLAMAGGLAQLEWSPEFLATPLPVSPLLYPREPGLHPPTQLPDVGASWFRVACQ